MNGEIAERIKDISARPFLVQSFSEHDKRGVFFAPTRRCACGNCRFRPADNPCPVLAQNELLILAGLQPDMPEDTVTLWAGE